MADTQSNIQVNIDTTQALASIKNLQRQISAFHSSMAKGGAAANAVSAQMQQTLINSINATGKFSAGIRTIRTTTESFTDSLEKNKFSLGEYFRYAGGASKTFGRLFKTEFDTINKVARENVKDLQTQYISLGRDASGAMKSIAVRPLSLDMTDLGTRTQIAAQKQALLNQLLKQGSTNLLNFGKNTQWAGRQLMVGFTLPLIAVGTAASKTFMDMETQAIRFKKVYGDLFTPTGESQQALKDIQELGKEFTKYGIAVSTTVGLAAEAAAAGFKGVDLQRQTAAATRLSILGQVESQKALETTIALQNAFSMSSENLAESIDFLNAVENQTVLSLDDISTAIPKAAPVVQQLGGDVKDLAFLMTAMKEGGINASEGANALKSGLASLINPTGKANEMLLSFGINAKKIVLDNKGDLKKTVVEFATALNMLDPLNRAQAIEQMFGKFQFARLSTLFANVTKEGTQASRVLDLAGASVQELAGLAEKELGMTSESAMNKFKGAVENLKLSLIPLGEQFLKAVTPIAEFITKILDKFNGLSDSTKKIIVTITAVVAGLGPVFLMTFGLLANGLANIIKGFTFLKTLFNKTGQSTATLGTEVRYMTTEQRNAAAVAASLDQVHVKLAQTFTSEAAAVNALTQAYQRAIAAQSQFVPVGPPITRGPIPKRAKGKPAVVGGTGNKDSELALLMPGETVIPTAMSAKYGGLINAMIADKVPGYEVGKTKSLYGGQERLLAPYTMFAPGNTPGGFGMDRAFLSSPDFAKSITNTMVASGAIEGGFSLTQRTMDELLREASPFADEITEQLRIAAQELTDAGTDATHISQLFAKKKKQIDQILSRMTASGPRGAAMARGTQVFAYPTDQDILSGGNARVPGVDIDENGNIVRAAPRSDRTGRAKSFQERIKKVLKRNPLSTQERVTRAHVVPEERVIPGGIRPLGGGVLSLPEGKQAAARAELEKRHIKLSKELGIKDIKAYDSGVKSVKVKDPYDQSRDRSSPHRLAAQDGRDDARAYTAARDKELTQAGRKPSGRKRRVATRPQGPAPIGATPQPGMTVLPIVPPDPKDPPKSKAKPKPKPKGIQRLASKGGGMGILGANMALSMAPDFAGKSIAQGALAGASLGLMFGKYGPAAGAAIGLVTVAVAALIEKQKQHKAMMDAMFKSSTALATLFGNAVINTEMAVGTLSSSLGITGTETKKLGESFGYTNSELKAFIDLVASLPKDDPLKELVTGLKNENDPKEIERIAKAFVTTQIAIGQIKPEQAQKSLDLLLASTENSDMVGTVFMTIKTQVEAVSLTLRATKDNTIALGKSLTDLAGAASNATSLEQMKIIINGIAASGISAAAALSSMYYAYLGMGNLGAADTIQVLEKISGITAAQSQLIFQATQKGFRFKANFKTDPKQLAKQADEFLRNKKLFETETTGSETLDYQSEQTKTLNKQIDLLKKKKKIIDDEIKKQEKISSELKKQNDYLDKQADLDKQIVEAKLRGDYIGAANLLQAKTQNTAEFNAETEKSALQAKSDALQARIDALQESSDKIVSAVNATTGAVVASGQQITDAVKNQTQGGGEFVGPDGSSKANAFPLEITPENIKSYIDKYNPRGEYVAGAGGMGSQAKVQPSDLDAKRAWKNDASKDALEEYIRRRLANEINDLVNPEDGIVISLEGSDKKIYKFKVQKNGEFIRMGTPETQMRRASGGVIRGAGTGTSDSIPALLSNGEYVIKAKSVQKYGTQTFDALNAGKFANGGLMQRFKNGIPAFGDGGPAWMKRMKTMGKFGASGSLYSLMEDGERWLSLKHGANENSSGFHKWSKAIARTLYNVPQGAVSGAPFGLAGLIGGAIFGGLEGLEGLRRDGSQYGVKGGSKSTEKGFSAKKELDSMSFQQTSADALKAFGISSILGPLINLLPKGVQKAITTKLGQNVVSSALIGMAPFNPTMGFGTAVKPTTSITQKIAGSKPGSAVEQRISGVAGSRTFAGSINTIENQTPVARTSDDVSKALVDDMFASAMSVANAAGRFAPSFLGRNMEAREGPAQYSTFEEIDPLLDDVTKWPWESSKPSESPVIKIPTIVDTLSLKQKRMIAYLAGKKSSLFGVPSVTQQELNSGYNWYYKQYGNEALDWDKFKEQKLASVGLKSPADKRFTGYVTDTRAFETLHENDRMTPKQGQNPGTSTRKFSVGEQRQSDEFDKIFGTSNSVRYETPLMDDSDYGVALRQKFDKVYDELIHRGYIRKAWYDAKGKRHEQKATAPLPEDFYRPQPFSPFLISSGDALHGPFTPSYRGKALTRYEFYKAITKSLPDGFTSSKRASQYSDGAMNYLDRPTEFTRLINQIYAEQHGIGPGEKIKFWKYDLYGSPLKNDKGEPVAAGYYTLDKGMAYAYARGRSSNVTQEELDMGSSRIFGASGAEQASTRGAYSVELYPHEIPQVLGLGGLKDEMGIVIGETLAKARGKFVGMAKADEYKYEVDPGAIRGLSPWKMYAPGDPWTVESPKSVFGVPIADSAKMANLLNTEQLSLRVGGKKDWSDASVSQVLKDAKPYISMDGTSRFVAQDAIPQNWGSDAEAILERMLKAQEMYNLIRVHIQNLPKVEFLKTLSKQVPRLATGGLIKGPGTGISDSIRASLGYAGGGSIRVSNGEYVVKASSVRDYGVKTMDAINNGTATVGANSGGTVYNINMPVTSNNANPEIVANEVMRKLKLEISKNNKTNRVGG